MARTSTAVLAALLAVAPLAALAQTATDATTTAPVVVPPAPAAAEAVTDAATAAATEAATEAAKDATATATEAAKDAAATATDAAKAAEAAADSAAEAASDATAAAEATPAATAPAATPEAGAAPAADAAAAPAAPAAEAPAAGAAPAAPAADAVGSYYTKSTHDDWLLRCLKTADGKDPCELYQLLKDEGQKPVAEVSIIPFSGKAAAILNFVAPLETDLQAALGLQIDTGKEHRYPFLVCAPIGCVSRIGMTADELGAMKRGSSGKVTLLPFGADPAKDLVNLTMSLKGFTAGFTALEATVATNQ